ncbi:DUF6482 family protein [Azotobacter chroococcum]|jgi:hypothetical protein|uniref:Cation transporter n=2 Tax=Azotobacter chroococcum TaxID=353 RepID=A0A0C4WHY0_9GAMM|nr:DUF6482 family protein [Azotobacter chroococcum]AJE21433.1 Hypothetical protein Achr_19780 [Azotobacter chroococcum NCIMB 8003]QQE86985.1 cation transporter [Azotobacter chroococcum]TBW09123.1 cation transporter [Azotobacter chroococcum]TKD40343.1 cation transporter [Azotobacter chroococcum]
MNMQQLFDQARNGQVDELNLISLEGGIYLLEAHQAGQRRLLVDDAGATLHLRSVEHARDLLQGLPSVPFYLLHTVVHTEMCGLSDGPQQPLRVPIALQSAWMSDD